jgi:hypothetical protein
VAVDHGLGMLLREHGGQGLPHAACGNGHGVDDEVIGRNPCQIKGGHTLPRTSADDVEWVRRIELA